MFVHKTYEQLDSAPPFEPLDSAPPFEPLEDVDDPRDEDFTQSAQPMAGLQTGDPDETIQLTQQELAKRYPGVPATEVSTEEGDSEGGCEGEG